MIKILFFIPGLSEGGAEKVLCNLVNNMDQTKFDITVQTIEQLDATKYLASGVKYKAMDHQKTRLGKKIFMYWFRLCAELKLAYRFFIRGDYDIEIAYLETIATKIIAQSTNKSAVKLAWVHCDLPHKEGIKKVVRKMKKQYEIFDKIICVSEGVQQGFISLFGNEFDTMVLSNVIDEKEICMKAQELDTREIRNNSIKLIAVGRLSKEKNFACLIDICAKLLEEGYLFQLDILGDGPERENLENQIEVLNLQKNIKLHGYVENPYPWMKEADALVCSSKYEGSSSVVLEALILGRTVITTPCSGMTELLGNSEYGMIAEYGEEGLYECIKRFLSDPSLKKFYEAKALERGRCFSKSEVLKNTEEFFVTLYQNNK